MMADLILILICAVINGIAFALVAKSLKLIREDRFIENTIIISSVVLITIIFDTVRAPVLICAIFIIAIIQVKENKRILIVKTLIFITVVILSDTLIGIVYIYILEMSYKDVTTSIYANELMVLGSVGALCIAYIMSRCLVKIKYRIKSDIKSKYKHSKKIIALLIVNVMTFIVFIVIINTIISFEHYDSDALMKIYTVFNIIYLIFSLLASIVIVIVFNEKIKVLEKESELNNLIKYNSSLETVYSDMRNFKHDYLNILSTLSGFIEEEDFKGLKEYFNDSIVVYTEKINNNNHKIGALRNLKVNSIKGLVFSKYIKAQELNINIEIEIIEDIEKINIEEIDFARCLGIIIDNAIEAASESQDKAVTIAFINEKNALIVIVKNTTNENIPPLYKLMEEGFSTKGEKRGIGLSNFNQILSKYKNVNKDINIENGQFIVTIECRE